MGGRRIAGTGQLLLALIGFVLLLGWMCDTSISSALKSSIPGCRTNRMPGSANGLLAFAAGWVWSLITSISLLRQVQTGRTEVVS